MPEQILSLVQGAARVQDVGGERVPELVRPRRRRGYPVLTRAGGSTVPGLYPRGGAPAAFGLGPSMRFIAGTHNVAAQLARSVGRRTKGSNGQPVPPGTNSRAPQRSDEAALQETG